MNTTLVRRLAFIVIIVAVSHIPAAAECFGEPQTIYITSYWSTSQNGWISQGDGASSLNVVQPPGYPAYQCIGLAAASVDIGTPMAYSSGSGYVSIWDAQGGPFTYYATGSVTWTADLVFTSVANLSTKELITEPTPSSINS